MQRVLELLRDAGAGPQHEKRLLRAWLLGGPMYRLQPVPATVGGHIRNLLMLQACLCVAAGPQGLLPAAAFMLLSFVFKRLSARFYSS